MSGPALAFVLPPPHCPEGLKWVLPWPVLCHCHPSPGVSFVVCLDADPCAVQSGRGLLPPNTEHLLSCQALCSGPQPEENRHLHLQSAAGETGKGLESWVSPWGGREWPPARDQAQMLNQRSGIRGGSVPGQGNRKCKGPEEWATHPCVQWALPWKTVGGQRQMLPSWC